MTGTLDRLDSLYYNDFFSWLKRVNPNHNRQFDIVIDGGISFYAFHWAMSNGYIHGSNRRGKTPSYTVYLTDKCLEELFKTSDNNV